MACFAVVSHSQPSVLTWHNDNARTGQNLQETILTPANVGVGTFKRLFTISVDGKVDAQPLYVPVLSIPNRGLHNVLYVVTEHDSVYALDADTGALLWQVSLLGSTESPSDDRGCSQVTPEIGITSTPVIDPFAGPHGTLYAVAMSKTTSGTYHQRLHALDLTTGAEEFGGPAEVSATFPGAGAELSGGVQTFDPKQHKDRAALILLNGVVYTSWGSHCDITPYTGWVIGYNQNTLARTSILNLTPNGNDGGIWAAGSGPAADSSGNLYLLTGNGTFDTTLTASHFPKNGDYGNAFVKISTAGSSLSVTDYFTMSNTTSESTGDVDLGSGGAMVLPGLLDSQGQLRSLAVGAGKDQRIYVVDRDGMGKFNNPDMLFQELSTSLVGGVFSSPAWFNASLFYGAVGDHLKSFSFNGSFPSAAPSQTAMTFSYPGTTPSVSANGTMNAIVWAAENSGAATLHAFDATDLSKELYNSNQAANNADHFGSGNKYIVPTVANGKVYVATTNGVGVFGLACSYSVLPLNITAAAGGGTQSAGVVATGGCNWTAVSNAAWLTVNSGSAGTGSGTVGYMVSSNSTSVARSGTITVAGRTLTVTQMGMTGAGAIEKVGIFRSGFLWMLDADGNRQFANPPDSLFALGGIAGDIPITGDWNGDGRAKAGIYRSANGLFILDYDGDGQLTATDKVYNFGVGTQQGDIPVVGDWNGDGRTKIGVFRQGFFWILDTNGNGIFEQDVDQSIAFGGVAGDVPIVGDWNGDGRSKLGLFRQGFFWILDYNGNGVVDNVNQAGGDKSFALGGLNGDVPVVGDWNGDGRAKPGIFRLGFYWVLDVDGNYQFDGSVSDAAFAFGGIIGDKPVVGKW
jgi:Putative binding domain, N-terminal/PQQ enzyme repeat